MVEAIRTALHDRISKLTWMSDSTKQKAYTKLAAMKKKVGYPDKWKDFSAMQIGRESYVQNLVNANSWWHNYNVNKLGKPVDRDEWDMTPQTYNAYYNPSNNEIVLPAGIFTVPGYRMKNWTMLLFMDMQQHRQSAMRSRMDLMMKEGSMMRRVI